MVARGINLLCGAWIFFAAFWLGPRDLASYVNDIVCGIAIFVVALIAMSPEGEPARWVNLVIGIWLLIAPWVFQVSRPVIINDMVLGAIVILAALVGNVYYPERRGLPGGGFEPGPAGGI
jgi:hypothetical protein